MSSTPRNTSNNNRRMSLSSLPMPPSSSNMTAGRRQSIEPSGATATATNKTGASRRLPPKSRVSMIPRVASSGRENAFPPSTPEHHSSHPDPNNNSIKNTPNNGSSGSSSSSWNTANRASSTARRRSISAGDHSHHKPATSTNNSTINNNKPSTNSRRKSLAPMMPTDHNNYVAASSHQRVDPRPINDKSFQQHCIKELLLFLNENGYEYPVSSKSLSRPSAKDFTNLTTFMLRLMDADFQRGGESMMKFEDEVVMNFKQMGYPFSLSKTALVAAGSPHTWPTLLAALSWWMHQWQCQREHSLTVVDLDAAHQQHPFDMATIETRMSNDFFNHMKLAYLAYMQGDHETVADLRQSFVDHFHTDNATIQQSIDRVGDHNAAVQHRIDELERKYDELPMLVEKREEYANALEQLHDLILQMEQHKTTLSQKETVLTAELADKNGKLDRMTTRINELKQSIAEQEFSVQDIYKMEGELKGLSEACDRAYMLREQHRKIILSVEEELASVCNDLDETCADYNGRIAELQLVPELGSKFYGFKAEIDSSQLLNGNPSDIIGFDLELVNRNVASAKSEYLEKTDKSKLEYQNILIELQQVSDAYDESLAKLKIVNDKKLKSDQILEDEIQMSQSQLAVRNREVDAMEAKIHVLQNPVALEEQMAGFQRQCAELEALRIERQESYAMELRAMVDEVNSACELMSEHDTYLRQQVAKVDAHWQTTLNQVDDVVLPANMSIGGSV